MVGAHGGCCVCHTDALDSAYAKQRGAWNEKYDENMEIVRRGLKKLGLEGDDVKSMEKRLIMDQKLMEMALVFGNTVKEGAFIEGSMGEGEGEIDYKEIYNKSPELAS